MVELLASPPLIGHHRWREVSDLSSEQPLHKIFAGQGEVLCHVAEETSQRPNPEGSVAWNGEVVLATFKGRQSEVAAGLTGDPVAQIGESRREVVAYEDRKRSTARFGARFTTPELLRAHPMRLPAQQ